jgi:hypothetical protein
LSPTSGVSKGSEPLREHGFGTTVRRNIPHKNIVYMSHRVDC